jgi:hypothetical protein
MVDEGGRRMSAPAMIYLALVFIGLGANLAKHGQPHTGKYSFTGRAIVSGIVCGLLYWGGFFSQVAHG